MFLTSKAFACVVRKRGHPLYSMPLSQVVGSRNIVGEVGKFTNCRERWGLMLHEMSLNIVGLLKKKLV